MLVSWQLLVVVIRVLPGGPPQLPQIPRADSGPRICHRLGPDGDREKCQHPEDRDRCDQVQESESAAVAPITRFTKLHHLEFGAGICEVPSEHCTQQSSGRIRMPMFVREAGGKEQRRVRGWPYPILLQYLSCRRIVDAFSLSSGVYNA